MTEPLVLALDTAAGHCAVAVLRGDRLLACAQEEMAKGQAERLMVLVAEVMAQAHVALDELDAIGVGTGPGNFTGIRIAVSAARGLALGLGIPAIGVNAFDALALGAARPCLACVDARRDMVFVQGFGTERFAEPALAERAAVADEIICIGAFGAQPGFPVAEAIARIATARIAGPHVPPAPLYLRAPDAAPARDAPPLIVP